MAWESHELLADEHSLLNLVLYHHKVDMISVREQKQETLPTPEVVQIPNINATTTDVASTVLSAYKLCYDEEQRLLQQQENGQPLINIRILGYMLIYNSGSSMLLELTRAVTSCFSNGHAERLNGLGQFFLDYWIRPRECTVHLHRSMP